MHIFTKEELEKIAVNVFLSIGCPEQDALLASDVLVSADIRGIDSHGVSRLVGYVNLWEAGRINPNAEIKIIRDHKSTFTIDGDGGLGLIVAPKAMGIAIDRA
ncbi:MAG: Ldh family oxidoreductase, partial [Bacteroidia bacterium]|nr:Ldh family oxidoreductase [Bacteroidia bacterium]